MWTETWHYMLEIREENLRLQEFGLFSLAWFRIDRLLRMREGNPQDSTVSSCCSQEKLTDNKIIKTMTQNKAMENQM